MPYYIAVYDVNQKRCGKALKLFRKYLSWVQNSVFEGELTKAQARELELKARKLLTDDDSVIIYEMRTVAYTERRVIGIERGGASTIL